MFELKILPASSSPFDSKRARALSDRLGLELLPAETRIKGIDEQQLLLSWYDERLGLRRGGARSPGAVSVDFSSPTMRHRRRGGQNELLGRAVGVSGRGQPCVLDATTGLGRDAYVLGDLGCRVFLFERDSTLQVLLEDGLQRERLSADADRLAVVGRLQMVESDARQCPVEMMADVDVIYLDPMFPAREKSAAVKKDLAVLQMLLGEPPSDDEAQLLNWALQQPVNRVVVKRPSKASCVAGKTPSHRLAGKAVRYDVYMLNRKPLP